MMLTDMFCPHLHICVCGLLYSRMEPIMVPQEDTCGIHQLPCIDLSSEVVVQRQPIAKPIDQGAYHVQIMFQFAFGKGRSSYREGSEE